MNTQLSDEDIRLREPIWVALSDLFLDTDVSLFDARIVSAIRASRFSASEVEQILRDEVGPVFYDNLLDVAGEWAGWTDEFIKVEVRAHLSKPTSVRLARRLLSEAVVGSVVKDHWPRLRAAAWAPS